MRRSRLWPLLVLVGGVLFALTVGPAAATTPQTATLVVMRTGDLREIGWYATFPDFADAGSWTSDFAAFGGGKSPVFAGLLKTTETGARGSFRTNWQVLDKARSVERATSRATLVRTTAFTAPARGRSASRVESGSTHA